MCALDVSRDLPGADGAGCRAAVVARPVLHVRLEVKVIGVLVSADARRPRREAPRPRARVRRSRSPPRRARRGGADERRGDAALGVVELLGEAREPARRTERLLVALRPDLGPPRIEQPVEPLRPSKLGRTAASSAAASWSASSALSAMPRRSRIRARVSSSSASSQRRVQLDDLRVAQPRSATSAAARRCGSARAGSRGGPPVVGEDPGDCPASSPARPSM